VIQGETRTKLGILTMSDWSINYAVLRNGGDKFNPGENGKLSYTVNIAEGFKLLIDGKEYSGNASSSSAITDFNYIAPYTKVPKMLCYSFEDLAFEPEFSAKNNGGEDINLTQKNNVFTAEIKYAATNEAKSIIEANLDPLAMAQLWSKFMTDDVEGTWHGFDNVVEGCKLQEGTSLYKQAKSWSRGVDIKFVSVHTLNGFSNSKVDNYIKYNDNLYSCDVYTEKNLHLKTGKDRIDIFSNRMFFGKVDGYWYLLDMLSIEH